MHSNIVSEPYCLLYFGPFFSLLSTSVVGPLEKPPKTPDVILGQTTVLLGFTSTKLHVHAIEGELGGD